MPQISHLLTLQYYLKVETNKGEGYPELEEMRVMLKVMSFVTLLWYMQLEMA